MVNANSFFAPAHFVYNIFQLRPITGRDSFSSYCDYIFANMLRLWMGYHYSVIIYNLGITFSAYLNVTNNIIN